MVKTVVLYGHPTDPAAFEEYYANTHVPIAAKMPKVGAGLRSDVPSVLRHNPMISLCYDS
jgi:uncharacterized protein (TIGR02118 family)